MPVTQGVKGLSNHRSCTMNGNFNKLVMEVQWPPLILEMTNQAELCVENAQLQKIYICEIDHTTQLKNNH